MNLDFSRLRRGCVRFMCLALCVTLLICTAVYFSDARDRARAGKPPHRWRVDVETVQGVSYTAKSIFINRDTILVRLYRTGDPTLLAERMFKEHGVDMSWTKDELIYDTADESFLGGGIQLPPTRLDNFLAKLP